MERPRIVVWWLMCLVSVLSAGVFSLVVLQSFRSGTLLKTLFLFMNLGSCQEVHFVIKYYQNLYLWNDKKWFLIELSKRDSKLQSGDVTHGRTKISWRLKQTIIKLLNHLEHSSLIFRAASVNEEALRGRSKINCGNVEMLASRHMLHARHKI